MRLPMHTAPDGGFAHATLEAFEEHFTQGSRPQFTVTQVVHGPYVRALIFAQVPAHARVALEPKGSPCFTGCSTGN